MNTQRAKEIAESPVMANVTYNGSRIYIQNVDDSIEVARIYPLEDPEAEKEVAIKDLIEH
jgi:small acid-soluble spore protein H (minor)